MNYKEWSEQYLFQSSAINRYIKKLKKEKMVESVEEERLFNHRIAVLYKMYLETRHTAQYLKACERRERNV